MRLYQGNYSRLTVFSDDPVAMALRWQQEGARYLHVVDLDGADMGRPGNFDVVVNIARSVGMMVEVGGGIRSIAAIEALLGNSIARVILGTAAVENPGMVREACDRWGDRVVVGIDARDGLVAVRGWKQTTKVSALKLATEMVGLGVRRFIYTDITRDGTLTEPNYQAISEFVAIARAPVIASGGVSSIDQLEPLLATGVEGVIVGRALYTGAFDLRKAIELTEGWRA